MSVISVLKLNMIAVNIIIDNCGSKEFCTVNMRAVKSISKWINVTGVKFILIKYDS